MDQPEEMQAPFGDLAARLRDDRDFAAGYIRAAMHDSNEPRRYAACLVALRHVAEAYGGVGAIARAGGGSRPSIYRALSAGGNPTLKTFTALLETVGLRLSIEAESEATPCVPRVQRGHRPRRGA